MPRIYAFRDEADVWHGDLDADRDSAPRESTMTVYSGPFSGQTLTVLSASVEGWDADDQAGYFMTSGSRSICATPAVVEALQLNDGWTGGSRRLRNEAPAT